MVPTFLPLIYLSFVGFGVASMEVVNVMVAASRNHYGGLLGVVASAFAASRRPEALNFLLLVPPGDTEAVLRAARCAAPEASVRVMDFDLGDWPFRRHHHPLSSRQRLADPLNYARFFVGDLFSNESDLVIYLDADVVVRRDLADLRAEAEVSLTQKTGAVVAVAPRDFKRVCGHLVHCRQAARVANSTEARLEARLHAFNAGVVVFHLERWRARRIKDDVAKWIASNAKNNDIYDLGSNPPLVLAVGDRWARIDPRWNCMRGIKRQHLHNANCWDHAFLRHFPGDDKPWDHPPSLDGWDVPRFAQSDPDCRRHVRHITTLYPLDRR